MSITQACWPVQAEDGHRFELIVRLPARPRAALLWLPALGMAARQYTRLADALAAQSIAVALHEWRGKGSSQLRAGRDCDWGYAALLAHDVPASQRALQAALPGIAPMIGGHSLGGQIACCRLALAPDSAQGLWLVGSGAPYFRAFGPRERLWLPLAYRFLPWLARRQGALPGRMIGFGGREARGLITDWAGTALRGRYAARGIDDDLEAALSRVRVPSRAVVLADDWLAPASSLQFLLGKLGAAPRAQWCADRAALGVAADHFSWMQRPEAVATWLAAAPDDQAIR